MRFERLRRQALPFGEAAGWITEVLASAVLAQADLFVTGDQGVLACLMTPLALPLLNPRACWQHLRGPG